jgi:hypothetical protein
VLTPAEVEFLAVYRTGSLPAIRRWCEANPDFPFRGLHNHELIDGYYRLVADAVARVLRFSE